MEMVEFSDMIALELPGSLLSICYGTDGGEIHVAKSWCS